MELHRSRQIDRELLARFDLVLVMESGHKETICADFPVICRRMYLLPELVDGIPNDFPDPCNRSVDPTEVGSILCDLIARGKEKILALAQSLEEKMNGRNFNYEKARAINSARFFVSVIFHNPQNGEDRSFSGIESFDDISVQGNRGWGRFDL